MDKLKELENLITRVTARLAKAEEENYSLKTRLRNMENSLERLRRIEDDARNLKDWKKTAQSELKKLAAKIEKEIQKAQENG
jgi:translation initiation factor 2B subunit (eIF-2B alpha/beta/delta family)